MRELLALLCLLTLLQTPAAAARVSACADRAELPPFSYLDRTDGRSGSKQVVGAMVDVVTQILAATQDELQIELLPWARCLTDVQRGRFQLALNVGRIEAQESGLLIGRPVFSLHSVYFYSRVQRPQGLEIGSLADLARYQVCGMGGYRYEDLGLDTHKVDRGTTQSYEQLVTKLHLGRCDLVVESREVLGGLYLINPPMRRLLVDGRLGVKPLPGAPQRELYIGVSPRAAEAPALLKRLDEGLERLNRGKTVDQLLQRYLQ